MSSETSSLTVSATTAPAAVLSPIALVSYTETGYLIGLAVLLVTVVLPLLVHAVRSKVFVRTSSSHQN